MGYLETPEFLAPLKEDEPTQHQVVQLESVHEARASDWNALAARRPEGTVFHRHEWIAAIEAGFEGEPRHLVARKDGNLIGFLPQFEMEVPKAPLSLKQVRSLYPGFGGPVLGTDRREILTAMLDTVDSMCRGRRVLHEIRACTPALLRYHDHLYRAGYRPARFKGRFVVDLDRPYEDVLAGMDRSRRRGIEKGRSTRHEVVEESIDEDLVDRLYPIHEAHMDEVSGTTVPRAFLEELDAMDDHLLVLSLYLEDEYVGSFVELLDPGGETVHGFLAALDPEYYEYHISELMYDAVMRWAHEAGYERYDFGGGVGDFENGIFRFKQGFGGRLVSNFYWERGSGALWPLVRMARSQYLRRLQPLGV